METAAVSIARDVERLTRGVSCGAVRATVLDMTDQQTTPLERFLVRDHDGNAYRITQAEWDARGDFSDWTRVDEHGHDLHDDGTPRDEPPDALL